MSEPAIQVKGLHKTYRMGRSPLHVLRGVSFSVEAGTFTSIVGASGSGKSTLLHLIGLLDHNDRGEILLHGKDVVGWSSSHRNAARSRDIGFVFQFYHLLRELTVLENVLMPAMVDTPLAGWLGARRAARLRAAEMLERIGLKDRLKHRPKELSGGEQQRVAIARALMNRPRILLADEPTGNLDSVSGKGILALLKDCNQRDGQTILMVTHDISLAEQTDRVLHLRDGKLNES
ncbi:MAG: ABC transporter ATP-binding protein [Phycisphaerae bacterium]|jgi:ABC-type lipoprotein export system ATPase subunit